MSFFRGSNGVPIFVYDPNPTGREAVVLLHGWPLNHAMFEYQFPKMAEYRYIAIDMRGFGRSDAPQTGYSYDTLSDDLSAILRQMGVRNFTLVGFSMGGAVALRYMRRHGGKGVEKLMFLSAAAPSFTRREGFPYGQNPDSITALIRSGLQNRPKMLQDFANIFFQAGTDEAFRSWVNFLCFEASAIATIQGLYTLRDSDLRDDTNYVHIPTAIFHGRHDQVCFYELGERLHEMIAGSVLYTFENSGHCIWHDELEKFNSIFMDFLRS